MKMVFSLINIILFLALAGGVNAQTQSPSILQQHVKINIRASIWEAVHKLADNGIPMGFEAREHWDVDNDPQVTLSSGTVEEILDSIVKQDASYKWEEVDGVIKIYPVMDRFEKSASFLAVRVGPFTVNAGEDRASMVEKLSNLFVAGKANGVEFHSRIGRGSSHGLPDKFKEQFSIDASDVRTTLNKLAKPQAYAPIWTVTPSKDRKTITVVL